MYIYITDDSDGYLTDLSITATSGTGGHLAYVTYDKLVQKGRLHVYLYNV